MTDWNIKKLPGVHAAPNIQKNPDIYEIENQAADPNGLIETAMWQIAPWLDRTVLDLGAGTGFHIPRFYAKASHVFAVEPHDTSRLRVMTRVSQLGLDRTSIMAGSAAKILLADKTVDIVHVRFAYFWGPGCEPGLAELERIIRPGGTAFIIDNDLQHGTFANWLSRSNVPQEKAAVVEGFWQAQGFKLQRIASEWRFETRADLEKVVSIEFSPELAPQLLSEHTGLSIDYHYCLYYRHY